jgi:NAD(P)H dehydrogenase (quinone)
VGKILVTGASGHLGRKTLQQLLRKVPASQLIGLVRDPSKAEDLAAEGIELRKGDYSDPVSLSDAFRGVEKLMLIATPAFTDRKTSHANAIDAAAKARVQHVVYMPIIRKENSDFVMKEVTEEDIFTEQCLLASGLTFTLARHPLFLEFVGFYIGKNAYQKGIRVPAGNGKYAPATRADLAEAHAVILTEAGHENKAYSLTGDPAISFRDLAEILSEIHGEKVPCAAVSEDEFLQVSIAGGYQHFLAEFALGWARGISRGEWEEQTRDLETLIGRKPTTTADFLRQNYPAL